MSQEQKYEEAFARLQDIVRKIENDEYSIDEIAVQLKEAQRLIKLCKDKLTKTEAEIQKMQSEHECPLFFKEGHSHSLEVDAEGKRLELRTAIGLEHAHGRILAVNAYIADVY